MLVIWGALVIVGLTVKGLIWLALIGVVLFSITGTFAAIEPAHPAPPASHAQRPVR
jgi:hypothetical protein